jgi:ketosteroid isomerase-like protein
VPNSPSDTRDQILAANEAFYRAFEKKNLEAMAEVWSHGIDTVCIHPGRDALRGWEQIRVSWEKIFHNTAYLEIDTTILSTGVSGDLAYIVLTEHVLQIAQGRKTEAQSMATNIFERMAQQWYLVHHHGSPIVS